MSKNNSRGSWKKKLASLTLFEKLQLFILSLGSASIIFIYLQTNYLSEQNGHTTESRKAAGYERLAASTLEMDKIFIENPQCRRYFYKGQDISEDDDNYELVQAIAEYRADYFDSIRTELGYIPEEPDTEEDRETWRNFIAEGFAKSPVLCRYIDEKRDWYMEDLVNIAEEHCHW